jgi:nitrogen PTS system EIIA component
MLELGLHLCRRQDDKHGLIMPIAGILSPDNVMAKVVAKDKGRLLRDLSERAGAAVQLPGNVVAREILKREALGSTGMGGGVAIPHARIPGLKNPFGILARLKKVIDFEAVDARPVDIVFLLLLTTTQDGEQLNALASIARKLRDPKIVGNIRHASGQAAMYCALVEGETQC